MQQGSALNNIIALPVMPFYALGRYRNFAVFLLVLVISIGPRIHLGMLQYGKLFDIRYEDILIVMLIISWFLSLAVAPEKMDITPLGKPILLYLFAASISTSFGLLFGWIEPVRALFYFLKEAEYFCFFIVTVNFIKDYKGVKLAMAAFLTGALVNGAYGLYQIVAGKLGTGDDMSDLYRHYGIATVGESAPAIVGNYFAMVMFLSAIFVIFLSDKKARLASFACMMLAYSGLMASFNRASVWGTALAVPVFVYFVLTFNRGYVKKYMAGFVVAAIVSVSPFIYGMMKENPYAERIINVGSSAQTYRTERVNEVFMDYFEIISINPVLGLGKSVTGDLSIRADLYGNAHNDYIRVASEMGIVGLGIFLALVWMVFRYAYRTYTGTDKPLGKIVGLCCIMWTVLLVIMAFAHDAFIAAKLAEMYWVLVGLTMAAYRCEQTKESGCVGAV